METKVKSYAYLMAIAFFFFVFNLTAQDAPLSTTKPAFPEGPTAKMEFEQTTYDFGAVEDGTRVSQVFTFTNTSDVPLVLTDARGSCGCTIPEWPREPIMPGETASLTVEFNSRNKRGKRNQKVTITANTNPPQTFLYLTGEVIPRNENDTGVMDVSKEEEKTVANPDCFAIYPNPTAELLKLEMEERNVGQSAIISIFSKTGQLMAKREIEAIDGPLEFNVSHYPAGTYVANVQIGKQQPESRCFVVVE